MTVPLIIILVYFTVFFLVGTIIKNNSIVDIGWGMGFVVSSVSLLIIHQSYTIEKLIVVAMVFVWGFRLFYYILKRNVFKEEDFRYQNWRKAWGKYVIIRAFFQVYMLQGLLMYVIGSAVFYFLINAKSFTIISYIGVLVFVFGYVVEVVGDYQLKQHLKTSKTLMTKGLWTYTRHPNYFGEAVLWFGLFITVFGAGVPVYYIISPITITVILRYISTPMLEERMKKKEGYTEYAKNVPIFLIGGKK